MKTISAELQAHLALETTTLATCWRVERMDGTVLGFTDHDADLTLDADGNGDVTYMAATGINRSAIADEDGLGTANLEVAGFFDSEAITEADLTLGIYDFAEVKIFQVNWADLTMGVLKLRRGRLGQVTQHRDGFAVELRGLAAFLSQPIGEVYTPDCRADLGDSRCQVDLEAFTVACTVETVASAVGGDIRVQRFTTVEDLSGYTPLPADGSSSYFYNGAVEWLTGDNAGARALVKLFDPDTNTLTLFDPPDSPIQSGDTFTLIAGCDKRRVTCKAKFDNLVNFRGEPWIPGLDILLRIPDSTTRQGD